MGVHSIIIFDRRGKTLFSKRYAKGAGSSTTTTAGAGTTTKPQEDEEQLSELRKLVFGMLFSLRELVGSLAPVSDGKDAGLHSIHTGAGTLHNYETASGLRFALYTTKMTTAAQNASIRGALKHVYAELWIDNVIKSPLYVASSQGEMNLASTNFESKLDLYLGSMPWFK